ncbi:MAG: NYN domain-containing protein [Lachnospiraceae bacterium]
MASQENNRQKTEYTEPNPPRSVVGILAHVDAGKTTLAESMLYLTGGIRKLGRVDHKSAFLDTYTLERERGITIFSKQAELVLRSKEEELFVTLMDTPGHVDFSAEMERTLQILDYAILVINGTDGVQGHVMTLWTLLSRYHIPVFLFINKMDQPDTDRERLMAELNERLDERCLAVDLWQEGALSGKAEQEFYEHLALCDEALMEEYLKQQTISEEALKAAIAKRKVFPCYFGSALRLTGVEEFLEGLRKYILPKQYASEFGARVFKIARDTQGNRLTYLKVTGGSLKVKEYVAEEKCDQLRLYSGGQFRMVNEVQAGEVCAVTGPEHTYAGQGLGTEQASEQPVLTPVLTYRLILPPQCDLPAAYKKLSQLEEEEPQLHLVWEEESGELHAQVMGEIQMEILKEVSRERFGLELSFGAGSIVYKETITEPVEGIGHFEPLRHYAEVHLLLTPLARGSGLLFDTDVSEDVLERNWQRLILTHLEEREHRGVLCGAPITDMRITLIAGRAHKKHTEGGDFREATYRAVRQGLKCAKSLLLEPVYEFRLEVPQDTIGRAMSDLQRLKAEFSSPEIIGNRAVLTGSAPVATMREYPKEVTAYTRGEGRISCTLKGYAPCHNAEEVIAEKGYDSEADLAQPTGSVFCAHGAGFLVEWDRVRDFMHVDSGFGKNGEYRIVDGEEESILGERSEHLMGTGNVRQDKAASKSAGAGISAFSAEDKELAEIFNRTYGSRGGTAGRGTEKALYNAFEPTARLQGQKSVRKQELHAPEKVEEYLLVDGYNIIFAWEELNQLSKTNLAAARQKLMDILCNYQGYKKCTVILVFDAYKVEGFPGEIQKYHNIYVVYTKEAETADQYIEKTVHEIGRKYHVTVATSDATEQVIIWGAGAYRMSAAGLFDEICMTNREIREKLEKLGEKKGGRLIEELPEDVAEELERMRLGKK